MSGTLRGNLAELIFSELSHFDAGINRLPIDAINGTLKVEIGCDLGSHFFDEVKLRELAMLLLSAKLWFRDANSGLPHQCIQYDSPVLAMGREANSKYSDVRWEEEIRNIRDVTLRGYAGSLDLRVSPKMVEQLESIATTVFQILLVFLQTFIEDIQELGDIPDVVYQFIHPKAESEVDRLLAVASE